MDFTDVDVRDGLHREFRGLRTIQCGLPEIFPTDPPARATVQVAALNDEARIELQMIAVKPK